MVVMAPSSRCLFSVKSLVPCRAAPRSRRVPFSRISCAFLSDSRDLEINGWAISSGRVCSRREISPFHSANFTVPTVQTIGGRPGNVETMGIRPVVGAKRKGTCVGRLHNEPVQHERVPWKPRLISPTMKFEVSDYVQQSLRVPYGAGNWTL
jgi:hypothetical protein